MEKRNSANDEPKKNLGYGESNPGLPSVLIPQGGLRIGNVDHYTISGWNIKTLEHWNLLDAVELQ